jgi:hypothetical protein
VRKEESNGREGRTLRGGSVIAAEVEPVATDKHGTSRAVAVIDEEAKVTATDADLKSAVVDMSGIAAMGPSFAEVNAMPLVAKPKKNGDWADSLALREQAERWLGTHVHLTTMTNISPFHSDGSAFEMAREIRNWLTVDESGALSLDAPVVMLMNTSSAIASSATASSHTGGEHFVVAVLLPKTYEKLDGTGQYEAEQLRCIFINSLPQAAPYDRLPEKILSYVLRGGAQVAAGYLVELAALVTAERISIMSHALRQQNNGSDCGWWALYNAFMLTATGGPDYLKRFADYRQGVSGASLRGWFDLVSHRSVLTEELSLPSRKSSLVDGSPATIAMRALMQQYVALFAKNRAERMRELLTTQRQQLRFRCRRGCPQFFVAELGDRAVEMTMMSFAIYAAQELAVLRRIREMATGDRQGMQSLASMSRQLELEVRGNQLKLLKKRRTIKQEQWEFLEKNIPNISIFVLSVVGAVGVFMSRKASGDAKALETILAPIAMAEAIFGAMALLVVKIVKARADTHKRRVVEVTADYEENRKALDGSYAKYGRLLGDVGLEADAAEARRQAQGLDQPGQGLALL